MTLVYSFPGNPKNSLTTVYIDRILSPMALIPEIFPEISTFEWDEGNSDKNWKRHEVTKIEAEQVFHNQPLLIATDPKHSESEQRYFALGRTDNGRKLMVAFTLRGSRLRVISARPMSRRERKVYDRTKEI